MIMKKLRKHRKNNKNLNEILLQNIAKKSKSKKTEVNKGN
jgi:hypothetical protein